MSTLKVGTIQDHTNSNTAMTIDSSGRVLQPAKPLANVSYTARDMGAHTANNDKILVFNVANLNQGNHYDTSTGKFTCPVTGRYYIGGVLTMINVSSSHTEARLDLESSNRTIYQRFNPNNYKTSGGPNGIGYSFGTLIDADANDTLKLKFYVSSGSKDADTQSDGSLFMYLVA